MINSVSVMSKECHNLIHDIGSTHTYGKLNGFIYGQDGKPVQLSVKDTKENRQFMEWLRIHDRSK